jgi:hypothetical protein
LVALKRALSSARRQAFEAGRTQEVLMLEISFAQPGMADMIQDMIAGGERQQN